MQRTGPVSQTPLYSGEELTPAELRLSTRNHGMPLEALSYAVTPIGLHYLLIHYDIPVVDPKSWRLEIGGRVRRKLSLSLDDLRARPRVTLPITFECAGNGRALLSPRPISQPWLVEAVGTGEWTGTPLKDLLAEAELEDDAVEVLFTGLDRGVEGGQEQSYERSLSTADAEADAVLLAYELNGEPLPPQHGFPLRLVVPGWYGMTNVKWLLAITALDEPFTGFQQTEAYRLRQADEEIGEPVTRMMPRALMVPPGIPDFLTRTRILGRETCELTGRAWSGWAPIVSVDVTTDGGATWLPAELEAATSRFAWAGWRAEWTPPGPGSYRLGCRAADAAGNGQRDDPLWNVKGYANNGVHWIEALVST